MHFGWTYSWWGNTAFFEMKCKRLESFTVVHSFQIRTNRWMLAFVEVYRLL